MTHAYSEMYLEDAMRTLGEAVDFALCDQGLTPAELTAILSNAFEMKQFERGIPRVVCGMAGDELARDIIAHAGLTPVQCRETYPFDRSPQYWAGWVLAYAQWMCSLGFNELLEVAPLDWIIGSYHPLHEASEDKFAQIVIDKWNNAQADKKGLKAVRKAAGLTQKELAAQSGVKLRAYSSTSRTSSTYAAPRSPRHWRSQTRSTAVLKTSSGNRSFWSTTRSLFHLRSYKGDAHALESCSAR